MTKKKKRIILSVIFLAVLYSMLFLVFLVPWSDIRENRLAKKESEAKQEYLQQETESELVSESTEIEEEIIEETPNISLIMVGDMLMHTRVMESGHQEDGSYNFDHLFKEVGQEIAVVDLALVNQETILGGKEMGLSSYPSFNSPQEVGDAEAKAGFDVILQATNHALDKGKDGILSDISFWESKYPEIACIGIYDSQEDQNNDIFIYEKDGIRLSILNYSYGTNGYEMPSGMPYAVNLLNKEKVAADIQKAKEVSDFVVVCPHWGTEYRLEKDSYQSDWTQFFLEQGVDLVIGTHPHVIEPMEWVSDEAGHKMLVYYSIGNFVNGTESYDGSPADRMVGGMAEVTVGYDENGQVGIIDYGVEPLVCHMDEGSDYTVYYLKDYTEELAEKNLILNQDSDFSLQYCRELVEKVWPNSGY